MSLALWNPISARRAVAARLLATCVVGALLFSPSVACAEDVAAATAESAAAAEAAEVANLTREFTDPLTTLPQLFFQDAYTPENYGTEAPANRLIGRVIIPRVPKFSLLPFVQLIRPSFSLVTVPTGKGSGDTRTEFGDMQLFDFAVLPWPGEGRGLLLAVGPVFVFPTATHRLAGPGAWQVGPGFGALYKGIPGVLLGCLIQHPISFAYTSDKSKPLSTLLVQPIVSVYIGRGFYLKSADSSWAMSWRQGQATIIPVSFGIGNVIVREGLPPINVFVSGEWLAYRQFAPVAPQTTIRFGMTIAFPGLWSW